MDEGKGINQEDRKKIWQRFYKADDSRARDKNAGTGLGLSIVKDIIDKHQAEITVQNNKQGGASFVITLDKKHIVEDLV